ncbi:uncharacterized protein si:dkey-193c22.1 isoform X3 [Pungitius pungitius]|uniref:uncharacterized protein si:dkey-193c22.1 isoform X3 n=1 Tax=Pungitius pungitius TaxID=134920 RepID=UPI0018877C03|nr:uncharacterized protein si:dkey-193c22.1 isoform X3 [Pungitius pungitius]
MSDANVINVEKFHFFVVGKTDKLIQNMSGVRCHMSLPVSVGVLLVGLPYSISLAAQWLYGWPNKPGYKKYIEALKPRRIYCLTRAVLETLKYLQYGRLYFQWKSWYKNEENRKHYEKDNIVLIGHSAGAHLCTLAALFLIDGREELFIEPSKQAAITLAIRGVIGLSGVYNIVDHYEHEQKRGVEYVSTMHKAMNGVENFPYYSPTHLLKKLSQDKLDRIPPFALLHGTDDIIVPFDSSAKFCDLLTSLSVKVSLYLLPRVDHTEIVTDLMVPDRRFYHPIYSCIKQEYRKLLGAW